MARRKLGSALRIHTRAKAGWPLALNCRRKFLRFFPEGFQDDTYADWERGYKWEAHERWQRTLVAAEYRRLLNRGAFAEIAALAVRIESRTNLLFSFEKMALRDAVKEKAGARRFAEGLFDFVYGGAELEDRFNRWIAAVAELPRRQTRVPHMAASYGVRLYRGPCDPHLLESRMSPELRRGSTGLISNTSLTELEYLSQPPEICRRNPPRPTRPASPRHDRSAVVHLGAGLGRVPKSERVAGSLLDRHPAVVHHHCGRPCQCAVRDPVDGQLPSANEHIGISARCKSRACGFAHRCRDACTIAVGHDHRMARNTRLHSAEQQVVRPAAGVRDQRYTRQPRHRQRSAHEPPPLSSSQFVYFVIQS